MSPLQSLPDDMILLLMAFMGVDVILSLRMTCKRFSVLTKLRWVWSDALQRLVISQKLPIPGVKADFKSLSSRELESRVCHAARFHQNWSSKEPKPRKSIAFQVEHSSNFPGPNIINRVMFLPGCGGEYIVTVSDDSKVLVCWEVPLDGSQAFRIAQWTDRLPITGVICNDDLDSQGTLAVLTGLGDEDVLGVLSLDKFHGRFDEIGTGLAPELSSLLLMHGDWVLTGSLAVFNWRRPTMGFIKYKDSNVADVLEDNDVLCAKYVNGCIIIVRECSIQLARAPTFDERGGKIGPAQDTVTTILQFNLATEAAIFIQDPFYHNQHTGWPMEPLTILLRDMDAGFNTLRQYDLIPLNGGTATHPFAHVIGSAAGEGSGSGGSLLDKHPFLCTFALACTRVIPVAPSCNDLFLGPSGKGIWIETHNITSNHSTYPARCVVGVHLTPPTPTTFDPAIPPLQPPPGNEVNMCKSDLFVQRASPHEVSRKRYRLACAALEDTVGRIAIGDRDGRIHVLDFA